MPERDNQQRSREQWRRIWIGLGANLGDRRGAMRRALDRLDARADCRVAAVSALYETAPRIVEEQPAFLNAVAEVETRLMASALMEVLLEVERQVGRERSEDDREKGPRRIDLDYLVDGEHTVDEVGLTVPHPGLTERAFVLEPLRQIAADVVVPGEGRTVRELAEGCQDDGGVKKVAEKWWEG